MRRTPSTGRTVVMLKSTAARFWLGLEQTPGTNQAHTQTKCSLAHRQHVKPKRRINHASLLLFAALVAASSFRPSRSRIRASAHGHDLTFVIVAPAPDSVREDARARL